MLQRTELGKNRTGIDVSPEVAESMMENIELAKPSSQGDEQAIARARGEYIAEAEPLGSIPPPEGSPLEALFLDKLGERLAFERTGTRLYEALIAKCRATEGSEVPMEELQRHRDEEAEHFALVGAAIQSLGGDPTAQTPCADAAGVEGAGLMQVLTDPKTTVAQGLHAILVAELTDQAGWEHLIELAEEAGAEEELIGRFQKALETEEEHLAEVREWYKSASAALAQSS